MWKFPGFAIFAFAIATVLVTASARANEKVSVRAWAHDSFGRVVFDVKKPVDHSAKIVDGKLVIDYRTPDLKYCDPETHVGHPQYLPTANYGAPEFA